MARFQSGRRVVAFSFLAALALAAGAAGGVPTCGPFTDITDAAFCPFVLEIFDLGITTGTTPTTYSPGDPVTRLQMAAFLSRSADRLALRSSRRAVLDQFWTTQNAQGLSLTTVGANPALVESDGTDLWVANFASNSVSRVHGNDGTPVETWTGATSAWGVLPAMGRIFVTGITSPGRLYRIDPTQTAGSVTTVASNLGDTPYGLGFDGARFWTASGTGSVSIITPGASIPWTVTTVTTGFSSPRGGFVYDGSNIWVTDVVGTLLKLNSAGAILQTVTVGNYAQFPVFDGANIWVPNDFSDSVSVVRASNGALLATLTGNGLLGAFTAAFDGERVLVTTNNNSVSLWKAADLTPLGSVATGNATGPYGACSDGVSFWITFSASNQLARF